LDRLHRITIGVTGYKLYRCLGSACTPTAVSTLGNVTVFSDTGLTASSFYRYQVSALDAAGNEVHSLHDRQRNDPGLRTWEHAVSGEF